MTKQEGLIRAADRAEERQRVRAAYRKACRWAIVLSLIIDCCIPAFAQSLELWHQMVIGVIILLDVYLTVALLCGQWPKGGLVEISAMVIAFSILLSSPYWTEPWMSFALGGWLECVSDLSIILTLVSALYRYTKEREYVRAAKYRRYNKTRKYG